MLRRSTSSGAIVIWFMINPLRRCCYYSNYLSLRDEAVVPLRFALHNFGLCFVIYIITAIEISKLAEVRYISGKFEIVENFGLEFHQCRVFQFC